MSWHPQISFNDPSNHCWVTEGRSRIEAYVDLELANISTLAALLLGCSLAGVLLIGVFNRAKSA
jgi:hypothetical protein